MCWSYQTPSSNNTREDSTHGHYQIVNNKITLTIFLIVEDGADLYSQQKQDLELTVARIMNFFCKIQTYIDESRENH